MKNETAMMETKMNNRRELNYELLRIVAMLMIVCLHYLSKSGLLGNPARTDMSVNAYIVWLVEAFCLVAVNVYVLISGYFGVKNITQNNGTSFCEILKKPIKIWKQVLFYSLIFGIFAFATGYVQFDIYRLFSYVFPIVTEHYWFATSYVVLCLLMPFLNAGVWKLSERELRYFILALLCIFSVLRSVIPMQLPWDKYGYDSTWFVVLYLTGAYIQKHFASTHAGGAQKACEFAVESFYGKVMSLLYRKKGAAVMLYVISQLLVFTSFLLLRLVYFRTGSFEDMINYGYTYNFIFTYTGAIGLFLAFNDAGGRINQKADRHRSLIQTFSGATFGVYLIHEHIDVRGLWSKYIDAERLLESEIHIFLLNMVIIVLAVYLICSIIEIIRINLIILIRAGIKKGQKSNGK